MHALAEIDLGDDFDEIMHALPAAGEVMFPRAVETLLAEPSKAITPLNPADPARIGYPPTFPIELALRTSSTRLICEAYTITSDEWDLIRHHPVFLADLARAVELVAQEGMSFKLKAKLQAEELLKTSWRLIHDPNTPASVKADLVKSTVRWAGLDLGAMKAAEAVAGGAQFAIQINFRNP